jgi:UV DNA damage endonuclease
MRLGFVAKSIARPELKSHDSRRWQNHPHLSVSLAYLRDMFAYLSRMGITMYRMSAELAPYATHPDLPEFHDQVSEAASELGRLGAFARAQGLRLSVHPGQHVVLNSPDVALVQRSAADLNLQAKILDAMGLGPEAVIVIHMGGVYGDRAASRGRFAENLAALPADTQQRLVLENDDVRFSVEDTLWANRQTGIRLVFDNLHHRLNNPAGLDTRQALAACLATWHSSTRPKVHFSSPRTEMLVVAQGGGEPARIHPPRWNNHADHANPFEFIDFLRLAEGLAPFDVMLELRAKDSALFQLRRDLLRFAPELAAALEPGAGPGLATEKGNDLGLGSPELEMGEQRGT